MAIKLIPVRECVLGRTYYSKSFRRLKCTGATWENGERRAILRSVDNRGEKFQTWGLPYEVWTDDPNKPEDIDFSDWPVSEII